MGLKCEDCGEIDYVLIDGYAFGDRLLEGVMFELHLVREHDLGNTFDAKITAASAKHFEKFNQAYWLAEAKKYAEDLDIATCPKCQDDVIMPGFEVEG